MKSLNYFFWFCSGADTEVLEQCPTDQRKYTSIGVIIFLVACFAALAMFFAIQTIVKTWAMALGISLLWGVLILFLDRLIVSTIVKSDTWQRQMLSALPRILLAAIIAIVISRPIEIKLFEELIQQQIMNDLLTEQEEYKRRKESLNEMDDLEAQIFELGNNASNLDSILALGEPETYAYRALLEDLEQAEKERDRTVSKYGARVDELRRQRRSLRDTTNTDYYERQEIPPVDSLGTWVKRWVPKTGTEQALQQADREYYSKRSLIRKAKQRVDQLEGEVRTTVQAFQDSLSTLRSELEMQRRGIEDDRERVVAAIQTDLDTKQAINDQYGNTFFKQLRALNNLGYDVDTQGEQQINSLWYIKWMIFLLFFVIELSPVFVKLIAPSSAYDYACQAKSGADYQIFRENMEARKYVAEVLRDKWKREQLERDNPFDGKRPS